MPKRPIGWKPSWKPTKLQRVRTQKVKEGWGLSAIRKEETLSEGDFALPPTLEETQREIRGRYPIDTVEKAKAILEVALAFAPKAELAQIVNRVKTRYPGIKISPGLLRLANKLAKRRPIG